jgi:hypothetical protein
MTKVHGLPDDFAPSQASGLLSGRPQKVEEPHHSATQKRAETGKFARPARMEVQDRTKTREERARETLAVVDQLKREFYSESQPRDEHGCLG